jgi:hypothetical protein
MNLLNSLAFVGVCAVLLSPLSSLSALAQLTLPPPSVSDLYARADWHEQYTGKTMQGTILEADWDFFSQATAVATPDGSTEWRLTLGVADAPALCVYFDNFHLPVGATLELRSAEGAFDVPFVEGPVDHIENNPHGLYVTGEVPGDEVELIYREPAGVVGSPSLHITGLGYFFRYLWMPGEYNLLGEDNGRGSDPCQVDVNCPEGSDWLCQRNGVVRLRISQNGGIFLCSGSMVNNTARDCRQLLLSSFHCADDVTDIEWALLKVRYNYEYLECGGTASINSHDRTGVFYMTSSDDMINGQISGSDFLLLEVEDPILASWEVFYAGWDATGIPAQEGVGIHHPSGDRKKISTFTSNLSNSSVYHPGAHWRVTWAATETNHGVTEGGSSGSPLFNAAHRIVGTLTGGGSFCNSPTAPDYYGKLSYHWDGNNPISEAEKLKYFLDPAGTGEEILDGSLVGEGDLPCDGTTVCGIVEVEEEILATTGFQLFPNPAAAGAASSVRLSLPGDMPLKEVRIYDAQGRLIDALLPDASGSLVRTWTPGVHFVTIETQAGVTATRKLFVQ